MFYEFSQNNSGGSFVVNESLTHRLFIEADNVIEAQYKAEQLGCYWNGVEDGMDCECCGDRWYLQDDSVNIENINTQWGGQEVSFWVSNGNKKGVVNSRMIIDKLKTMYPGGTWLREPIVGNKYGSVRVVGKLKIDNIEQYAQVMADMYGWCNPDVRIFYKGGTVKEIFTRKFK